MLAECSRLAASAGLEPALYAQALHELDLLRRYRTIIACGAFGLGSTREQDEEALGRLLAHLEPGGLVALDTEARWRFDGVGPSSGRPAQPPAERRRGADGAEYALVTRVLEADEESGRAQLALHAWMWRDGVLAAEEEHVLTEAFYERYELVAMLERAGFVDVEVRGQYADRPPSAEDDMLVYLARRPAAV